ncbi:MAG: FxsA family protein [Parvibaculales bacterium]
MSLALFIIFILIPAIEIYLFAEIGGQIGGGWTILLIFATAFFGVGVARLQGMALLHSAAQETDSAKSTGNLAVHGSMLLIAGIMLFLPGFFTDAIGFLLLIPPLRPLLAKLILNRLVSAERFTQFGQRTSRAGGAQGGRFYARSDMRQEAETDIIIDTDFEVHEEQVNKAQKNIADKRD